MEGIALNLMTEARIANVNLVILEECVMVRPLYH